MKTIADTGWIVAFRNNRDEHHRWAKRLGMVLTLPILTCEAVLAEAAFRLESTRAVLDMLESGLMKVAFRVDEHQPRLSELSEAYRDRKPDLADVCLICMSEIFQKHTILTVDHQDFSIYRRHRTQPIPFLSPKD